MLPEQVVPGTSTEIATYDLAYSTGTAARAMS